MVRSQYQINAGRPLSTWQLMRQTSSRNSAEMPLAKKWLVNWSRFFPVGASSLINPSRLLSPTVSTSLMNSWLFGPIDEANRHGLPYRDLMSAALADLWSVKALAEKVAAKKPELMANAYAANDKTWREDLQRWLEQAAGSAEFQPGDVQSLAADPPLPFFVLFEAEKETGGKTLGILGSIIVAEVLYALLEEGPLAVGSDLNLATELDAIAGSYGKDIFDSVSGIKSMPALIRFIAGHKEWQAAQPPLI